MIQEIPIGLIDSNPFQTRITSEADLLNSVEALGLLRVAFIVRPNRDRYQLAFGHRALHTLKRLGAERVACDVREVDDATMARMLFAENEDRRDLTDFEKGEFFQKYKETFQLSTREAAKRLKVDPGTVSRCLAIVAAAKQVLGGPNTTMSVESFADVVTETKFKETSKIKDLQKKTLALGQVVQEKLTVGETKALVAKVSEGEAPDQAASDILLDRERAKQERYAAKKDALTPFRCRFCRRPLHAKHLSSRRHVLEDV